MVGPQRQDVVVVAQPPQFRSEQRACSGIKRLPNPLLDGGRRIRDSAENLDRKVVPSRRQDRRLAVGAPEDRAQRLVAPDHRFQCVTERVNMQRAAEPIRIVDVVGRGLRRTSGEAPDALLTEREHRLRRSGARGWPRTALASLAQAFVEQGLLVDRQATDALAELTHPTGCH